MCEELSTRVGISVCLGVAEALPCAPCCLALLLYSRESRCASLNPFLASVTSSGAAGGREAPRYRDHTTMATTTSYSIPAQARARVPHAKPAAPSVPAVRARARLIFSPPLLCVHSLRVRKHPPSHNGSQRAVMHRRCMRPVRTALGVAPTASLLILAMISARVPGLAGRMLRA